MEDPRLVPGSTAGNDFIFGHSTTTLLVVVYWTGEGWLISERAYGTNWMDQLLFF